MAVRGKAQMVALATGAARAAEGAVIPGRAAEVMATPSHPRKWPETDHRLTLRISDASWEWLRRVDFEHKVNATSVFRAFLAAAQADPQLANTIIERAKTNPDPDL